MKIFLAILFSFCLYTVKVSAQQVDPLPFPKAATAYTKPLKNAENILMGDFKMNCDGCFLGQAKYFAMINGVSYQLNSAKPLPFPTQWIREASVMQKKTGYEVMLTIKERKYKKAMGLIQPKESK